LQRYNIKRLYWYNTKSLWRSRLGSQPARTLAEQLWLHRLYLRNEKTQHQWHEAPDERTLRTGAAFD